MSDKVLRVINSRPLGLAAAAAGVMENHLQLTSCTASLMPPTGLHDELCAAAACEPFHSCARERSSELPCLARSMPLGVRALRGVND